MTVEEYWIGKGVDVGDVWQSYAAGFISYAHKFKSTETHLLRIQFRLPSVFEPLFNHEAVFKTVKAYFHELKSSCLPYDEYMNAAPLFLFAIQRGSGIWEFLGELRQLLILGTTLSDEKTIGQKLDNLEKRLEILRKYFGATAVDPKLFQAFMNAKSSPKIDGAVEKLIEQGIQRVEVSTEPFRGNIEKIEPTLVDLRKLLGPPKK